MRVTVLVVALGLVLAASTAVLASQYVPGADNFESYEVGTVFTTVASPPAVWSDAWGDSATYLAGVRYNVVETAELDGNPANKVVHIVDAWDSTTKNGHLRTNFLTAPYPTTGVYTVTMDINPLYENGPFKVTMTNGGGWTSGLNWLCAVGFGSTAGNTYFPGIASAGTRLFLQKTTTTQWDETGFTYTAGTWYTLKFVIDVTFQKYRAFIGERGGPLTELTSGFTPWITGAGTPPSTFGGMIVATSTKANEGAEILLDNVVETAEPGSRAIWDGFSRADNWQLGTTEDPNHYVWENGYESVASITGREMVFGATTVSSDGAFLNNYAPAAIDLTAQVRSIGGQGAGIAYRKDVTKFAGNPGFAYRLFWSQDGTGIQLGYFWYGMPQGSVCTYTPATPIDWTVPHIIRIRAVGSSHKVWLDGTQIMDWTDSQCLTSGHVVFYRVFSEYHVDDFSMLDLSVQASNVATAKAQADGTDVVLSGPDVYVTGAFEGFFYLEDVNRAAGIKVVSPQLVSLGNNVVVTGTIKSVDGEKYIEAKSAVPDASNVTIQPVGTANRSHGSSIGLSNIGLLTRIWGNVTAIGDDWTYFYVDDGTGASYEQGKVGIKVYTTGILPGEGDHVSCTGVASMDPGGIPVIRMRQSEDLTIY